MLQWFPRARLIFTDTDSLYYEIPEQNVEEKLFLHKELLDYSDYPTNHPFYDPSNRLLIGKFKCETKGASIREVVALKPKMYSLEMRETTDPRSKIIEKQRIKGVSRAAARQLRHKQYFEQLTNPLENRQINRRIGHKSHQLFSLEVSTSSFVMLRNHFVILRNHCSIRSGSRKSNYVSIGAKARPVLVR